jgi:metallo-beta-lactamase family protein
MPKNNRKRSSRVSDPHIRLHFLGAARTVTGSFHLLEIGAEEPKQYVALDFGLDQQNPGRDKQNRLPPGVSWSDVSCIVNSHGHLDHLGAIPIAVKNGFKGKVYATEVTCEFARISLPDSGYLQEQDAARKAKRIFRQCESANEAHGTDRDCEDEADVEPLYTQAEAIASLSHFHPVAFNKPIKIAPNITLEFLYASHLLGAAIVKLDVGVGAAKRRIVFSGDIGRQNMPFLQEVATVKQADYVLCEGTYGDRLHVKRDRQKALADLLKDAQSRAQHIDPVAGAGAILIPAFALGRVQSALHDMAQIGVKMPVFLDSPMAIKANAVHRQHKELLNPRAAGLLASGKDPFKPQTYAELLEWKDSLELDKPASKPFVIVGSSGNLMGGRIVRHLIQRLPYANNTVILIGFQAPGSPGHHLMQPGVKEIRIQGQLVPVRAKIVQIGDYSGHADYLDGERWLKGFSTPPRKLFLVHGEEKSLLVYQKYLQKSLGWNVEVPHLRDYVDLE